MSGAYDHAVHAGNQGDVAKHVALAAALWATARASRRDELRYADTFAGYALNSLPIQGEWRKGLAVVNRSALSDPHAVWWHDTFVSHAVASREYPGSAVIAGSAVLRLNRSVRVSLWDVGVREVVNQVTYLGLGSQVRVHGRSASPDDIDVRDADFVLIDPPGVRRPGGNATYPRWEDLVAFVSSLRLAQAFLLWLPVGVDTTTTPPSEPASATIERETLLSLGCRVLKVRWAIGGRTVGCQMAYRIPRDPVNLAHDPVVDAVNDVAAACGWPNVLGAVRAVEHWP